MKVPMTEYLRIDLETETWECRVCDHEIAPATGNYKEGLLVHNRDPREIHPPIIDPEKYRFTFSPTPNGCGFSNSAAPIAALRSRPNMPFPAIRLCSTWKSICRP